MPEGEPRKRAAIFSPELFSSHDIRNPLVGNARCRLGMQGICVLSETIAYRRSHNLADVAFRRECRRALLTPSTAAAVCRNQRWGDQEYPAVPSTIARNPLMACPIFGQPSSESRMLNPASALMRFCRARKCSAGNASIRASLVTLGAIRRQPDGIRKAKQRDPDASPFS